MTKPAATSPHGVLRFITLRRVNRGCEDTSSLGLGGRGPRTPGTIQVIGNLEHCTEIAPRTEADRLALIAWLDSDECKTLSRNPSTIQPGRI